VDGRGSPYRVAAPRAEPFGSGDGRRADGDLLPVLGFVWVVSLLRVAAGLAVGEVFGAEASIAVIALILLPPAIFRRGAPVSRASFLRFGRRSAPWWRRR
jgi:hypothetical protein